MEVTDHLIHNKDYSLFYNIKPIAGLKQNLTLEREYKDFSIFDVYQVDIHIGYAVKLHDPNKFVKLDNCIMSSDCSSFNKDYHYENNQHYSILLDTNNTVIIFKQKTKLKDLRKC